MYRVKAKMLSCAYNASSLAPHHSVLSLPVLIDTPDAKG